MDSKEKVRQYLEQLPVPASSVAQTDNNSVWQEFGAPYYTQTYQAFTAAFREMRLHNEDQDSHQMTLPLPRGFVPGQVQKIAIDEQSWVLKVDLLQLAKAPSHITRVNWYNIAQQQHVQVEKSANMAFAHAAVPERMASFPPLPLVMQPSTMVTVADFLQTRQVGAASQQSAVITTANQQHGSIHNGPSQSTRSQVRAGGRALLAPTVPDVPVTPRSLSTLSSFDVPHITRKGRPYVPSITEREVMRAPYERMARFYRGLDEVMAVALAKGDCRSAHLAWRRFQLLSQYTLVCLASFFLNIFLAAGV